MGAGGNGNNQRELERNGNKARLNLGLGMEMGMNHREWEGMALKQTFPLISSTYYDIKKFVRFQDISSLISTFGL